MKKIIFAFVLVSAAFFVPGQVNAQANAKDAIEKAIYAYRDALNASDAGKVIALYTADGVLLPDAAPTAVGTDQVKGTYQYVFDNFTYNLEFSIGEVVITGNYSFVSTTSKGTVTIKASGQTVPDENRELFVMQKVNGEWKIARYIYNKNK
jgi:uncharacterized protein (TIGR02246 family)